MESKTAKRMKHELVKEKVCTRCLVLLSLDSFALRREKGRVSTRSWCKVCYRNYQRAQPKVSRKGYVSKGRKEAKAFVQDYKAKRACADCKLRFHPVCMDFDHKNGNKLKNVAQLVSWGLKSVQAEIKKCELVCANCHRLRTLNRGEASRRQKEVL